MEIKIRKIEGGELEYIEIGCHAEDSRVRSIVRFVKGLDGSISGAKGEKVYEIPIVDIFYIESVERICLPMQGHGFDPSSRKIPHALGATQPIHHNY